MHIEDLRQIHDSYDHVYLAPHLDDAPLSCGGAIARHSASGARVLVVTICTAVPEQPFSAFAEETHVNWGLTPEEAVSARLHEETLALERLGADSYWAGMLDAIYRRPDVYTNNDMLFGTPAPDDPLGPALAQLIAGLRARASRATFYAPLGVGKHVDHQLTFEGAARGQGEMTTAFYEDFPYVTKPGALEERFAMLGGAFIPSTINIDETISRKIGAIAAYTSQLDDLFGGAEPMRQRVLAYAEALRPEVGTYGERLWLHTASATKQEV